MGSDTQSQFDNASGPLETFSRTAASQNVMERNAVSAGQSWHKSTAQTHVHFVQSGVVSHRIVSENGRSLSVALSGPGELVEGPEAFAGRLATATVVAAQAVVLIPGVIVRVPVASVRKALNDADFRWESLRALNELAVRMAQLDACGTTHDLQSRLAHHLYLLCGYGGDKLPLTPALLVDELGENEADIQTAMEGLQRLGALDVSPEGLEVLCRGRLAAFSCACRDVLSGRADT